MLGEVLEQFDLTRLRPVHVFEYEDCRLSETEALQESPCSEKEEPSLPDGVVGRETEQECEIAVRLRRFLLRHGLAHGALELLPSELRGI